MAKSHSKRSGQVSQRLEPEDYPVVLWLVEMGFSQHRIASLFDVNQGRISEVVTKYSKAAEGEPGPSLEYLLDRHAATHPDPFSDPPGAERNVYRGFMANAQDADHQDSYQPRQFAHTNPNGPPPGDTD